MEMLEDELAAYAGAGADAALTSAMAIKTPTMCRRNIPSSISYEHPPRKGVGVVGCG